jgi:hypothetical protein
LPGERTAAVGEIFEKIRQLKEIFCDGVIDFNMFDFQHFFKKPEDMHRVVMGGGIAA